MEEEESEFGDCAGALDGGVHVFGGEEDFVPVGVGAAALAFVFQRNVAQLKTVEELSGVGDQIWEDDATVGHSTNVNII